MYLIKLQAAITVTIKFCKQNKRVLTVFPSWPGSPLSPFSPCRGNIKHDKSYLHTVVYMHTNTLRSLKLGNADLWPRWSGWSRVSLTAVTLLLFLRCLSVCGTLRWERTTAARCWSTYKNFVTLNFSRGKRGRRERK